MEFSLSLAGKINKNQYRWYVAVCNSRDRYASFGGLVRNDQGRWIKGFCGRIGVSFVLEAELHGLKQALKLADRDRRWELVEIEIDSKTANQSLLVIDYIS